MSSLDNMALVILKLFKLEVYIFMILPIQYFLNEQHSQ